MCITILAIAKYRPGRCLTGFWLLVRRSVAGRPGIPGLALAIASSPHSGKPAVSKWRILAHTDGISSFLRRVDRRDVNTLGSNVERLKN